WCKSLHSPETSTEGFKDLKEFSHEFLSSMISRVFKTIDLKRVTYELKERKASLETCFACKLTMALLQHLIEYGKQGDELVHLIDSVCLKLDIETPEVCNGIVRVFRDEFLAVISKVVVNPSEVCGIILGNSCAPVHNPLHNWSVPLPNIPKPPVAPKIQLKSVTKKLRVLHISDTHIDPHYVDNGNAECKKPLCCREKANVTANSQSGYWGDYRNCDVPLRTFEQMLKHITTFHKDIDYILWTGDIPPHDIWKQTRKGQLSIINSVSTLITKYLGAIPIYPCLGNHESAPVNSFPPPFITGNESIEWLYSDLKHIWSKWLPKITYANIKKGAYYSVKIRPNLKLISLNTNYCNNQNWWLLLNSTDPAHELQWLVNELQNSELLNETVHIIGHIPPGTSDCLQVWSANYYRIINRFENTVVAQFFGHTHNDEFEIFYDDSRMPDDISNLRATNVAYITPSVTTFGFMNPGYRIYTIDDTDGSSHFVLDHETYYLNLTEANKYGRKKSLHWKFSYSAKKSLNLTSLAPQQWHKLVLNMMHDDSLFQKFYRFYYNRSDYLNRKPCDNETCKLDILCRLVTGKSHHFKFCDELLKISRSK
ncbi:sphingomyelin phosphodiesterase-like protein, partial [Dinothrombium tinctorium]